MKFFFKTGKSQKKPSIVKYEQGLLVWNPKCSHLISCLAFLWDPLYYDTVTTSANPYSMNFCPQLKDKN